jgi:hypothetical protein
MMFWLAVLKTGVLSPPSSSTMRWLTSRARRLAAPPSPQADWSSTIVACLKEAHEGPWVTKTREVSASPFVLT